MLFALILAIALQGASNQASAQQTIDDGLPSPQVCLAPNLAEVTGIQLPAASDTLPRLQPALLERTLPLAPAVGLPAAASQDETPWSSTYLSACAFVACAIMICLQRRRRVLVKVVLS